MNVMEFSYLITPIAGAVGGGNAVKTHGTFAIVSGIVIGLLVGIAVITGIHRLILMLADRISVEAQNRHQWIGVLMFLLLPVAQPVVAFAVSSVVVVILFPT